MPRRPRSRIAPEDLARLRLPGDPRLSPDGRFVVYVETRFDLRRNRAVHSLRLVDLERGNVREWTHGEHSDSAPSWTPDSRAVVFVSDRGGSTNLWRIGLRDRAPERLTSLDGRTASPKVSPDGRLVAFLYAPRSRFRAAAGAAPPVGPELRHLVKLDFKHDGRGFRDATWTHLWVLDLATRRTRQITSGEFDDGQHDWSPDSRRIAFVSNRIPRADVLMTNSDVFVVPARGGRIRQLTRARGPKQSPAWSPDGRHIAFVGHTRFPDTVENFHVWVVSVGGGRVVDLMPRADLMCDDTILSDTREHAEGSAPQPVWSADGRRIFFVATQNGESNVWEVPATGGTVRQRSFGRHEIPSLTQSADGRRWAFVRTTAISPGEVFVAEALPGRGLRPAGRGATGDDSLLPGARVRQLTRLQAGLFASRPLVSPEELRIATREGHEIHGWVLRGGRGRRPAVLVIHGGPYAAYGWSFFHEFQVLAARGYHVFFTNLRGSVGYGRTFMRALVGKWGSADYDDLMRVTDAIEALPFVDRERIAVTGGSYGGYLASWAIAHTRRYRCAIAMRGVYNLVSMHGTSDSGSDLVHEFEQQAPWESIDRWWRVSPLAHVERIRTPLLLVHAEDDLRCPVGQAEEMFVALRVLGRDVEFIRFLGESHGLSRSGRPHNRIERLRRIVDWLDRKLG